MRRKIVYEQRAVPLAFSLEYFLECRTCFRSGASLQSTVLCLRLCCVLQSQPSFLI